MIEDFPWCPVTLERAGESPVIKYWAGFDASEDIGPGGGVMYGGADGDARWYSVATVVNRSDQEFRFTNNDGTEVVARPTVAADAMRGGQFPTLPFDLPVDLIGAIVSMTVEPNDVNLTAGIDDEGDVHTMLLETPLGIYARYGMQWILLTDVGVISHLNVVNVSPEDLDLYDEADTNGQMVNITAMAATPESLVTIQEPAPPPTTVTASLPTHAVVVASLEDLPNAIRYAESEEGKGSRWYVARRAKALGYTETLPWEVNRNG
ncbi:MAG TPA: hypothetical protein VH482_05230 [Thermomicrobiales bacterium]|jgi:hypothetical protein